MDYSLCFEIEPVAKGRPKIDSRGRFPRTYTPEKTRIFESQIAQLARIQWRSEPLTDALKVGVSFFIRKPKSAKRTNPSVKPDLDNYLKAFFDALNGIIWVDDSQIIICYCSKLYSDYAHIMLDIEDGFKP